MPPSYYYGTVELQKTTNFPCTMEIVVYSNGATYKDEVMEDDIVM